MAKYVPTAAVEVCSRWIMEKNIHLKITRGRASKFGDYRPMEKGRGHRITVNHDLNQFAFLITFIHEVAHLHTHVKYNYRHDPHGREWKHEYRLLLEQFTGKEIFPHDVERALKKYLLNPAASSCSDQNLFRVLKKYDDRPEAVFHLEELPESAEFSLFQSRSGLVFRKGPKIRTRFQCLEIRSKRIYFVNALAEVQLYSNP